MLEIKIVTDMQKVAELCAQCGITDTDRMNVLAATDKGEVIAYTVFMMDEESLTLLRIMPPDDYSWADGMVRSTMHVAVTRGIDKLYFTEEIDGKMLSKLSLVKSEEKRELDAEALFRDKCCGK